MSAIDTARISHSTEASDKNALQSESAFFFFMKKSWLAESLILLAILTAGLAIRTYNLSAQSLWADTYPPIVLLKLPDLASYQAAVRFLFPDTMPVFFSALWIFSRITGTESVAVLRYVSIIPGMLSILLLYYAGSRLYGRKAGRIAALCLALSPVHAMYSQDFRVEALIALFALLSCIFLMLALSHDRSLFWALHIVTNLLLLWTHLFGLLLITAQGCFLLIRKWRQPRLLLLWALVHGVILISASLWLWQTVAEFQENADDFPMRFPAAFPLACDFVADDALMTVYPFRFQGQTWPFLPDHLQQWLTGNHKTMDFLLLVFFLSCLLLWIRRKGFADRSTSGTAVFLFLLLLLFIPPALLTAGSVVWRPLIRPRYTLYCAFALYLITGAVISRMRDTHLRRGALVILLLLFGYQLSLMLPASTQTDWRRALDWIERESRQADTVFVKGTMLSRETFMANARKDFPLPVQHASTYTMIRNKSREILANTQQEEQAVWAVIEPYVYTLPPLEELEKALTGAGLVWESRKFDGMNGLYVYRIQKGGETAPAPEYQVKTGIDYNRIAAELEPWLPENTKTAQTTRTLRRFIDSDFPLTRLYFNWLALQLCDEEAYTLAEAAARQAIHIRPASPFAHFALAVVLADAGQPEAAAEAMQESLRHDHTGYYQRIYPLFASLYLEKDPDKACDICRNLDKYGIFLPRCMRNRACARP
jgi:mannosyltransferase